jgi:hypothetical protein
MKNKLVITFLSFCISFFFGCKAPATGVAGNYIYKTECLGNNLDGTLILKTWGNGKDKKNAILQAQKNAIRDVLFTGILDGKSDCGSKPLLTEVNVQQKNETYFDVFFSNKGDYSNFISSEKSKNKVEVKPSRNGVTTGVVVKVLKSELKQKMISDGIIK